MDKKHKTIKDITPIIESNYISLFKNKVREIVSNDIVSNLYIVSKKRMLILSYVNNLWKDKLTDKPYKIKLINKGNRKTLFVYKLAISFSKRKGVL